MCFVPYFRREIGILESAFHLQVVHKVRAGLVGIVRWAADVALQHGCWRYVCRRRCGCIGRPPLALPMLPRRIKLGVSVHLKSSNCRGHHQQLLQVCRRCAQCKSFRSRLAREQHLQASCHLMSCIEPSLQLLVRGKRCGSIGNLFVAFIRARETAHVAQSGAKCTARRKMRLSWPGPNYYVIQRVVVNLL